MRSGSRLRLAIVACAALAALGGGRAARAQFTGDTAVQAVGVAIRSTGDPRRDSVIEQQTRAVASQLRCPVCQGLSLQDSPSELAQQMKAVVRDQLIEGKSPAEVRQYFVEKYGEWILLEPQAHGFNWLVYALPFGALVGGLGVIALVLRRWTGTGTNGPTAGEAFDDDADEAESPRAAPAPSR